MNSVAAKTTFETAILSASLKLGEYDQSFYKLGYATEKTIFSTPSEVGLSDRFMVEVTESAGPFEIIMVGYH
jgi:hypothetical protein